MSNNKRTGDSHRILPDIQLVPANDVEHYTTLGYEPFNMMVQCPSIEAKLRFTAHQVAVLNQRICGKTYESIAADLDISPEAVKKILTTLCKKFGCGNNREQLIAELCARGIIVQKQVNQLYHQECIK